MTPILRSLKIERKLRIINDLVNIRFTRSLVTDLLLEFSDYDYKSAAPPAGLHQHENMLFYCF
ncbi:MAG TPA: hypothetical protein VIK78_11675 [Ruminiclostridium sp.]